MSLESSPHSAPGEVARGGTLSCLHVVAQQTGWLLPVHSVSAIINRPMLQSIPTVTVLDHLVIHGSKVFSALSLARAWHSETEVSLDGTVEWGLLVGPPSAQIVLLVDDLLGSREIEGRDVEWLDAAPDEPLLGIVQREDELLLLVDPLRSDVFQADSTDEDEYPWIDLRKLSTDTGTRLDDAGDGQLMVVLEDIGLGFALPAHSVFDVQRVHDRTADKKAPRLSEALGGDRRGVEPESGTNGDRPTFRCRVGTRESALAVTFDKLIAWQILDMRRIRPWSIMEQFSALGAFTLRSDRRVVVVVDPDRLLERNRDRVLTVERAHLPTLGAPSQTMHIDSTKQIVKMRVSGEEVAVSMADVRFIASLRSSHIHAVTAPKPAIVGVLERTEAFSTIIDLGQLLFMEPVPRRSSARLVTVESGTSSITLLVESVPEPVEVQLSDLQDWRGGPHSRVPDRYATAGVNVGEGQAVPVLNLSEIIEEFSRTSVRE